jgi:oligopeptide transport system ATP-binding protein
MALLEISNLKKYFPVRRGFWRSGSDSLKAIDGVSLAIEDSETIGLVGESGCGKSTVGRCLLRLVEPSAGEIRFEGRDIVGLPKHEMRALRRSMQIIFQDPFASLDPRMRVGDIVGEGLEIHGIAFGRAKRERVIELLARVGLREEHYGRYPHEFSGGQRQRIGIARALILEPRFIVADEPVSALDVSIQAQILNLLGELQRERRLTFLFISHDLRVVEHMSHRVAIMYLGKLVEIGAKQTIFSDPKHPYTRALLSAVPKIGLGEKRERMMLQGDVPSPINPPSGCSFHTRCPFAEKICREIEPVLTPDASGRAVACHVFG